MQWLGRLHIWPWDNIIRQVFPNNEITGTIPRRNIQWHTRGPTYRTYQQTDENDNSRIMHVGDTILIAAAETGINEN